MHFLYANEIWFSNDSFTIAHSRKSILIAIALSVFLVIPTDSITFIFNVPALLLRLIIFFPLSNAILMAC